MKVDASSGLNWTVFIWWFTLFTKSGSIEELQNIIRIAEKTVSIGGGRFSMGGQIVSSNSMYNMRKLNKIIAFLQGSKDNFWWQINFIFQSY